MSNGIMMISCTNGRSYYEGNEGLTAMESDSNGSLRWILSLVQRTHLDFVLPLGLVTEGSEHQAVPLEGGYEVLPFQHCRHLLVSTSLRLDEHV